MTTMGMGALTIQAWEDGEAGEFQFFVDEGSGLKEFYTKRLALWEEGSDVGVMATEAVEAARGVGVVTDDATEDAFRELIGKVYGTLHGVQSGTGDEMLN